MYVCTYVRDYYCQTLICVTLLAREQWIDWISSHTINRLSSISIDCNCAYESYEHIYEGQWGFIPIASSEHMCPFTQN
jgi:hypothetical protein